MKYTEKYHLRMPEDHEAVEVDDINANAAAVDAEMKRQDAAFLSHKSAAVLDHPDDSVTTAKLQDDAVTDQKIGNRTFGGITGKLQALLSAIQAALDKKENTSGKGAAGGYAGLDTSAKIPLNQLPDVILGQMVHAGDVAIGASAVATLTTSGKTILGITSNTITLTNNTAVTTGYRANQGNYFLVTAAGTFAGIALHVGDWLIANETGWGKLDNTDEVTGVKGDAESTYRTGNVNITKANVGLGNVTNDAQVKRSEVKQAAGTSTTDVMSQKAVTDAIAVAGGGDMSKATYDPNNNGKIANAQLENMTANTIKGRAASAGAPEDLTAARALAIVESGVEIVSNANGTAWKYPSGVMVCRKTVAVTATVSSAAVIGGMYQGVSSAMGGWAAMFVSAPTITGLIYTNTNDFRIVKEEAYSPSASAAGYLRIVAMVAGTANGTVTITAEGRWK